MSDGMTEPIRMDLNRCATEGIVGWALHPSGVRVIRVSLDETLVGTATLGLSRPDVAAAFADVPHSATSGFAFAFPAGAFVGHHATTDLRIDIEAGDGSTMTIQRALEPFPPLGWSEAATDESSALPVVPLPSTVVRALRHLRPGVYESQTFWSDDLIARAVADVVAVLRQHALVLPILRYGLYLQTMATTFDYIAAQFPWINRDRGPDAKDAHAMGTSPQEMLCIAHHMFVLRDAELQGRFVECGCFKGFSTCCLSQACAALGIQMDVFDSFAGLPASDSSFYQAGDFAGSFEEVRDNLRTFGRLDTVQAHRGFFSDTLKGYRESLLCLWMDVDLTSSAADVMQLMPQLPPSSCVFTHECSPESFLDGRPVPESSLIMPPIVDSFQRAGRNVGGRFLTGDLGVLLDRRQGIPVLDPAHVFAIAQAARA
jgi:O-methyltransferase